MPNGTEPITDDEVLLRRIPTAFRPDLAGPPLLDSFLPHRANDPDGLSVTRLTYASAAEVGRSAPPGKACYVGRLTAGQIRQAGLDVIAAPEPGNLGHALIPALNSAARSQPAIRLQAAQLLRACTHLDSPFVGQ